MHAFLIFGALLHVTALAVLGFFVLFAAARSTGLLKTIGNVLGVWLFILAVVALVGGVLIAARGGGHMGRHMMGPDGHAWMPSGPAGAPSANAPPPAPPPPPPPANK